MTYIDISVGDDVIIDMQGHADYAVRGCDVVCSAISTLEYILIGWCKSNMDKAYIKSYESGTGYSYMHIIPVGNEFYTVLEAAVIGFKSIADTFPDYINFKINPEKWGDLEN